MVTRDALKKADATAARRRADGPIAVAARYDRRSRRVVVGLSSGIEVMFSPKTAQGLEDAKPAQLDTIEISPSGLGLHFPKLDADLYLPRLLDGWLGSRRWMRERGAKQNSGDSSGLK
jgi:Protein of unknown function (DUF2442)